MSRQLRLKGSGVSGPQTERGRFYSATASRVDDLPFDETIQASAWVTLVRPQPSDRYDKTFTKRGGRWCDRSWSGSRPRLCGT